jgi:hypothetical protein
MTWRKFWAFIMVWFITTIVVVSIGMAIYFAVWNYFCRTTPKYNHDLLVALQDRPKDIQYYPDHALEGARTLRFFLDKFGAYEPKENMLKVLAEIRIFSALSDTSDEELMRMVQGYNAFAELQMPVNMVFEGLMNLKLADSHAPGCGLYSFIDSEEGRAQVISALKGELPDSDLPKVPSSLRHFYWVVFFFWLISAFSVFMAYLFQCYDDGVDEWYEVPFKRPGTYLILLILLPGALIPVLILAIFRLEQAIASIPWRKIGRIITFRHRSSGEEESPGRGPGVSLDELASRHRAEDSGLDHEAKWFFLEGFQDWRQRVSSSDIVLTGYTIFRPDHIVGVIFPASEVEVVFRALGIEAGNIEEIPTDRSNLFLLRYDTEEAITASSLQRYKQRFAEHQDEYRKEYIALCQKRLDIEISRAQSSLGESQKKLERHMEGIVKERRNQTLLRGGLANLEALKKGEDTAEKFSVEFNKLLEVAHVECLAVDDGVLKVYTDMIYIDYDEKRFRIGEFEIRISGEGNVRMRNLSGYIKRNCQHPHVREEIPCLGNISEGIAKLVADYQFSVAAQILIEFLHSYNASDPHCPITEWKKVKIDEKTSD